jgi:hypothetical protein
VRDSIELKKKIIEAGYKAVDQLVRVAEENILKPGSEENPELAADRLKNAAATKKLAIFDAFEILTRIELEQEGITLALNGTKIEDTKQGFAERKSISGRK